MDFSPRGWGGSRWNVCFDSSFTISFLGSELVLLERLRLLRTFHGNEAETQRLPGPRRGSLSLGSPVPPSTEGPRGEHRPATRGSLLHPRSHNTVYRGEGRGLCRSNKRRN